MPLPPPPAGDDTSAPLIPSTQSEDLSSQLPAITTDTANELRVTTRNGSQAFDLITNGSFEAGTAMPTGWTGSGLLTGDRRVCGIGVGSNGSCAFRFAVDNTNVARRLIQNTNVSVLTEGAQIELSYDARGDAIALRPIFRLRMFFTDGTFTNVNLRPAAGTYAWRSYSRTITVPKNLSSVRLIIGSNSSGRVFFDNIQAILYTPSPTAQDDSYSILRNTTLNIAAPGVLANDVVNAGTISAVSPTTAGGTATLNPDGSLSYTPPSPSFVGEDTFTYTLQNTLGSSTATVRIAVNPLTPDAVDDSYTNVVINTPYTVSDPAQGLLANDTVENATITNVTAGSAGGNLTVNANGTFTYTPVTDFTGPEVFAYTLTNVTGFDTATVSFNVNPIPAAADDGPYTVIQGELLNVAAPGILANDTLNGATWTGASVTSAQGVSVTIAADGSFSYTAPVGPNFAPYVDTFIYTLTNTYGSDSATVSITVNPPLPVANDDTYNDVVINTPYVIAAPGIYGNDTLYGASFSAAAGSQGGNLSVTAATGAFTYTPAAGFTGEETFVYTLTNATGSDTATITFTVNPIPVARDDGPYTATQGVTLNVSAIDGVRANDDFETSVDVLTSVATAQGGTVTLNADGSFSYLYPLSTTDFDQFTDSFTYTARNTYGTDTATVTITVNPPLPIANDDTYNDVVINTPYVIAAPGIYGNDTIYGASFSAATGSQGGNLSVTAATGAFTYTPAAGFTGEETFVYTLTNDAGSDTATITFTVNPIPVARDDGPYTATQGVTLNIAAPGVRANDDFEDTVDVLTGAATAQGGTVTLNADGSFSYLYPLSTTDFDRFTDSFTYTARNTYGTDTATVTITVNPPLPIANDDTYNDVVINTPYTIGAPGIFVNDTLYGASVSAVSIGSQGGILSGNAETGAFTYTPAEGFTGDETFVYTLTNDAGSDTATITFTVNPIPVARDDGPYMATQGVTLNVTAIDGVRANDDFEDSVDVLTGAATAQGGTVTLNADGSFSYLYPLSTTNFDQFTDSFTYTARNTYGTDTATVTITVNPPLPVAEDDAYNVFKGDTLTITAPGILDNDTPYGATINNVTQNAGFVGTLNVDTATGAFTYIAPATTPTRQYVVSFDYTLTNDAGSDTATVEITISPEAPVAVDDTFTYTWQASAINEPAAGFLTNDTVNEADVTFTAFSGIGTLIANANGSFSYTPPADQFDFQITFGYTLTNETGSSSGTVTIEINPPAPIAVDDTAIETYRDTPLEIDVTANDTLYGATISAPTETVSVATTKGGTAILLPNGQIEYTPPAGFVSANSSDVDTFSYTVTNSTASDSATVSIWVRIPKPTAVDDDFTTSPHISIAVPEADGLLANDTLETGTLTAGTFATTQGGSIVVAADGSFTYNPPAGLVNDVDTYVYTLTNETGSDTATISITIDNNQQIWFVDASAAAGGDGSQAKPFDGLDDLATAATTTNDIIYVHDGAYINTVSVVLKNGQKLIGNSIALSSEANWLPEYAVSIPTSTRPTLRTTATIQLITLAIGNTIRGFEILDTPRYAIYNNPAVTSIVGALTISDVLKSNSTGMLISIDGDNTDNVNITFVSVAASTTLQGAAINIVDVGGTFTVTGTTTIGGGGNNTGGGLFSSININNSTGTYTFTGRLAITNTGGDGITIAKAGTPRTSLIVSDPTSIIESDYGAAMRLGYTNVNAQFVKLDAFDPSQFGLNFFFVTGTLISEEFTTFIPDLAAVELKDSELNLTLGTATKPVRITPKPKPYNSGIVNVTGGGTATVNLNNVQFMAPPLGVANGAMIRVADTNANVNIDGWTAANFDGNALTIFNGSSRTNAVTVKNATLSNYIGRSLVYADLAGDVTIENVTATDIRSEGIFWKNSRNLTVTGSNFAKVGTASGHYAIEYIDDRVDATYIRSLNVSNTTFGNLYHHGIYGAIKFATLNANISGVTFNDVAGGALDTIPVELYADTDLESGATPTLNLTVEGSTFNNFTTRAIGAFAQGLGSPVVDATIQNNVNFTADPTWGFNGIEVGTTGGNGTVDFTISGNTFDSDSVAASGYAIVVNGDGNNGQQNGTISNNQISRGLGIYVINDPSNPTGSPDTVVSINNNTLNTGAIQVLRDNGNNSTVNAVIENNTVTYTIPLNFVLTVRTGITSPGKTCIKVNGNNFGGNGARFGNASGTLEVANGTIAYTGNMTTYMTTNNIGVSSVSATSQPYTAVATCATPTPIP